jgi:hypothetical protein
MKKLLVLGLVSLTVLGGLPQLALAGPFCWRCRCSKYSTYICIRPYNAFSPVCYGNIMADGCCPLMMGGGQFSGCCPGPSTPSCFTACAPSCTMGFDGGGCLPAPGNVQQPQAAAPNATPPAQQLPQGPAAGPQFAPPNPAQLNPAAYMWGYNPYLYNYGVMQTSAYQNYYGNYAPAGYNGYQPNYYQNYGYGYGYGYGTPNYGQAPNYGQVPSYWYGNGR